LTVTSCQTLQCSMPLHHELHTERRRRYWYITVCAQIASAVIRLRPTPAQLLSRCLQVPGHLWHCDLASSSAAYAAAFYTYSICLMAPLTGGTALHGKLEDLAAIHDHVRLFPRKSDNYSVQKVCTHRGHGADGKFEDLAAVHEHVGVGAEAGGLLGTAQRLDAVAGRAEGRVQVPHAAAIGSHLMAQQAARLACRRRLHHHCAAAIPEEDARACVGDA